MYRCHLGAKNVFKRKYIENYGATDNEQHAVDKGSCGDSSVHGRLFFHHVNPLSVLEMVDCI